MAPPICINERQPQGGRILAKLIRTAGLATLAVMLCGFGSVDFGTYRFGAYPGEPVAAAVARFGPPIEIAVVDGDKVYFWRARLRAGGDLCKIWGAARHGVMVNWGYQSCAY